MKRIVLTLIAAIFIAFPNSVAQNIPENSKIDTYLINGDYNRVIDTCRIILATDSLNAELWYKMGLAYQNLLSDDKSFDCFSKSAALFPGNTRYNFMLAKACLNDGKPNLARPLLLNLCTIDSMNWAYANYLTSIYMQEGRYDECIRIYTRFSECDTSNYTLLDKIGLALLKKGDFNSAIDYYNKSTAINNKDITALQNLAYLYASTYRADTAIKLLTRATKIDTTDMDLYIRRAGLYFVTNNNKRALNDYLRILGSGDSAILFLKRAGIGYSNNLQPKQAIPYLTKAYQKDSSDYETANYLARSYFDLKDAANSIRYYKRVIKILTPVNQQIGIAYVMMAEAQKNKGLYKDAINNYLNATKISSDINLYIIIANLYDEKLNDIPNAIYYYELFLDNMKKTNANFKEDYVESVKKRLQFLKDKQDQTVSKHPTKNI